MTPTDIAAARSVIDSITGRDLTRALKAAGIPNRGSVAEKHDRLAAFFRLPLVPAPLGSVPFLPPRYVCSDHQGDLYAGDPCPNCEPITDQQVNILQAAHHHASTLRAGGLTIFADGIILNGGP